MCVSLSVTRHSIFLSVCLSAYVHVKGDISQRGRRAASHLYFWEGCFEALINHHATTA